MAADKEYKDHWSLGGQIFFTGGKAWGLTSGLRNVCLGDEAEINSLLDRGRGTSNKVLNSVLVDEKKAIATQMVT